MVPFTREIVRLGGSERVYLLVTLARFDINKDGIITPQEYEMSRVMGEKCVPNPKPLVFCRLAWCVA